MCEVEVFKNDSVPAVFNILGYVYGLGNGIVEGIAIGRGNGASCGRRRMISGFLYRWTSWRNNG